MADIMVTDYGTLVGFVPFTEAGVEWIAENVVVPDHLAYGKGFYAEHRYAAPIIEGMIEAGLGLAGNDAKELN